MTKRIFILFIHVIITISIYGQVEKKWELGISLTPSIVTNDFKYDKIYFVQSFGVNTIKKISNNISLRVGCNYYKTDMRYGCWGSLPTVIYCHSYTNKTYLDLPISGIFYFYKNRTKVNPYLTTSITNTLSIRTVVTTIKDYESYSQTNISENKKIEYGDYYISLGLGTDIYAKKNYVIRIEPFFRQSISSLYKVFGGNGYNTMIGLKLDVNRKL